MIDQLARFRRKQAWEPAALTLLCVALAALTLVRYAAPYLTADGVEQAVMSVQDVDLFYWGQNRLVPVVSWLASPISDPSVNLVVCLLLQAFVFHLLLLMLARMTTPMATGGDSWAGTAVVFGALVLAAHAALAPPTLYAFALEGQPYALSFLCCLGAFAWWRRGTLLATAGASGLVFLMLGVNPSALLLLATLAITAWLRGGSFWRWSGLGAVAIAGFVVWTYLAGVRADVLPPGEADLGYYDFSLERYADGMPATIHAIGNSLRLPWILPLAAVAVVALLLLSDRRRRVFLLPFTVGAGVVGGYCLLFSLNFWVAANGWHFRYFALAHFLVLLTLALPVAAALWTVLQRASPAPRRRLAVATAGVLGVATLAALAGPVADPNDAPVLRAVEPTAEWAANNDVRFYSGHYWSMWPLQLHGLEDGRDAAYVTGLKSGGDPDSYRRAFDEERRAGRTPRAICVNWTAEECIGHLTLWTDEGWVEVPEACPAPPDEPSLMYPPVRGCLVLENRPTA